jgi:hypothetical protein
MIFLITGMILFISGDLHARTIEGVSAMKLSTPVNKDLSAKAQSVARDSLRIDLLSWINETNDLDWDTGNVITDYHLNSLVNACIPRSKSNSRFEGKNWIYTVSIDEQSIAPIIANHNAQCDSSALKFWDLANEALNRKELQGAYTAAVAAIFYGMGHIGPPVKMPGTPDRNLIDEARSSLQNIFSLMSINASEMVVTGKPGTTAKDAPVIAVAIDSVPFTGLHLRLTLAGGREIFSVQTDQNGQASLSGLPIPYVSQGTFFTIAPHLGKVIHVPILFSPKDLGLPNAQNQEQILIIKIIPAIYSLKYTAQSAGNLKVPQDFSGTGFLDRYLQDSCYLRPQATNQVADLVFDIVCQASSYTSDATETTTLKVESKVDIMQIKTGVSSHKEGVVYEQTADVNKPAPQGLFFWQSATNLKRMVKSMLLQM